MKESPQPIAQRKASSPTRNGTAGPKGVAVAPPAYGIGCVDQAAKRENRTGLPDSLKAGVEGLSGLSMDAVRVHYNSPKPAQLQAFAYTQGSEIHVAPGQERHLAHEAWHAVQQAQGRVRATTQMKGRGVNDDPQLEMEAERIGGRAAQMKPAFNSTLVPFSHAPLTDRSLPAVVQCRAPETRDIPGFSKDGETVIFDSLVHRGKIFEKTVDVVNHGAQTVIAAYQQAITPIGTALQVFDYTDVGPPKFPNLVRTMPLHTPAVGIVNYLMNNPLPPLVPMQTWLNILNQAAMQHLFDRLDWNASKEMIDLWFHDRDTLLGNQYVGLLDPLIVRITFHTKMRGQHDWIVDTQFASSATGYIVRVHDGQHNITGSIVTNGEFTAGPAPVTTNALDYYYSSTHVTLLPATTMGARINDLTTHQAGHLRSAQHDAFDAFTVQSAEGARFQPVAALGRDATLNANFYTKPGSGYAGAHSVTLQWLYTNWGTRFGRAYGITRQAMEPIVNAHGVGIHQKPGKPCYNLTSGIMEKN